MTLHTNDTRALLLIGRLYFHPLEIVKDPSISRKRKRALLADWASDRNAVESKPALRRNPVTGAQCSLAEIIAALRLLDDEGPPPPAGLGVRAPPLQKPSAIIADHNAALLVQLTKGLSL